MAVDPAEMRGKRIEPPVSLPSSRGGPRGQSRAEPPDEPPGVRSRFQGLRVVP